VNKDHVREVMLSYEVRYMQDRWIFSQQVFHAQEKLKGNAECQRY
jgi:hypothetical protein